MILLVAFALVVASVPLTGGDLRAVGQISLRWMPALFATLVAQVVLTTMQLEFLPVSVMSALHVATYVPAVAFVYVNRGVRGLPIVGLGGGANLAAIVANKGVMPSLPAAAAAAGQDASAHFVNSSPTADAALWFLGDVFAWPAPLPLANVFSVGDVLLVLGAAVVLHSQCRRGSQLQPSPSSWSIALPGEDGQPAV